MDPAKLIYFPSGHEAGMKRNTPRIVYAFRFFPDDTFLASANEAEANKGKGSILHRNRAAVYTEQAWHLCLQHLAHMNQLDEEYNQLMKTTLKQVPLKMN